MAKILKIFTPLCLFLLFSCGSSTDKTAVDLIGKSIQAHGGQNVWKEIQSLSFTKETSLFFEDGSLESNLVQQITFRHQPYYEAKMSWEKDSVSHLLKFDGMVTSYIYGNNEIQNEGFLQNKKKEIDAAHYVMTKPFDLLGANKNLVYQGLNSIADAGDFETIKVIDGDPKNPDLDTWWYYFDPKTNLIAAYKTKTGGHISLVYNSKWDDSTGIVFPSTRESYRVDSVGNKLYLRAVYHYSNFKLEKM